jgi:hypothetical protein
VTNSTITGNVALGDGYVLAWGGGVANRDNPPATLNMRNCILAWNDAANGYPDLVGALSSDGYNLITQGGSGFDSTDLLGVDPLLGPLQNNGGPMQTVALLAGSPALNAGDPAQLGVPDQRGVVRSGGVNIGAYQASASTFVITAPATVTAGTPFDMTAKAVDTFGQTALGYRGTVTFSSTDTDPGVMLPADYTFQVSDSGSHTFTAAFTLITPGEETLTVTDLASGISGNAMVHL